jgi:hypothetical protein
MDPKTTPPVPTDSKKNLSQDTLSKINPAIFAPASKKTRIHPRDLLKNPREAFVFAEILRPLDY